MSDTEAETPRKRADLIDPKKFQDDVAINPNDLQRCFMEHAALYAYYAARHVSAMRVEASAKVKMEITEARVGKSIRDQAVIDGTKITEARIEQELLLTGDVIKARFAYNEAKALTALAAHTIEAFKQRRDMLVQIGASAREEMKGDLRLRGVAMAQGVEALRTMTGTASAG